MESVSYSVLASNLSSFDSDEYAKMLGVELFDMRVDTNLRFENMFLCME